MAEGTPPCPYDEEPNWWEDACRLLKDHDFNPANSLYLLEINHDDDCARLRGIGVCDCDPNVSLVVRGPGG